MSNKNNVIELKNINKFYHVGGEEVRALDGATLQIKDGDFVSIVGPSGSGKSTMMNIIGCLDVADSGSYHLDGQAIGNYSERQLAKIRNEKIGFIFQGFNLLGKMNAYENVELPLIYMNLSQAECKERVEKAINQVGLWDRRHHLPTELSGGQQQRIAIARALVTKPSLLLADEPTGNLDSNTGKEILKLFHSLHDGGITIVLITHDETVAQEAERMIRIKDGKASEVER